MLAEVFTFTEDAPNEDWLMIDLPKYKTGLSHTLFAITYKCIDDMYGPRIRVCEEESAVIDTKKLKSVFYFDQTVKNYNEIDNELFKEIKRFILKNEKILWRFWLGKINGVELLDGIVK